MMKDVFVALTRNLISLVGVACATIAGSLILAFLVVDLLGFQGGPYLGILVFAVLPGVLIFGLILIPIGSYFQRRRRRKAEARGEAEPALPVFDFNKPRVRHIAIAVVALTAVNMALLAGGAYKAVEVMDSTGFCGSTCHVMKPELTVYSRSPHARVACVNCHIGAGAGWFVKSKISGTRQLFAVLFNSYERPIATPVHSLRPARDTCEQCHWPQRYAGDRLKVLTAFTDDEKTEALKTVLLLNIGGSKERGKSLGIHWHVAPENRVRYLSDKKRLQIAEIELADADGTVKKHFKVSGEAAAKIPKEGLEWRTMDCVDCHNRPTHVYGDPANEIDQALLDERLDKDLPFIHREALRIIQGTYASHEAARAEIPAALKAFYEKSYPDVAKAKADAIKKSGDAIAEVYAANVFPDMNVKWGTYPSFANHKKDSGCFRCHNDDERDDKGKKIAKDCDGMCHTALATEAKKPEILDILYPE
jgi:nitrate/TMAO reductase-like tetraheme cytochrome c subunit